MDVLDNQEAVVDLHWVIDLESNFIVCPRNRCQNAGSRRAPKDARIESAKLDQSHTTSGAKVSKAPSTSPRYASVARRTISSSPETSPAQHRALKSDSSHRRRVDARTLSLEEPVRRGLSRQGARGGIPLFLVMAVGRNIGFPTPKGPICRRHRERLLERARPPAELNNEERGSAEDGDRLSGWIRTRHQLHWAPKVQSYSPCIRTTAGCPSDTSMLTRSTLLSGRGGPPRGPSRLPWLGAL
jgi:hypothetical protein